MRIIPARSTAFLTLSFLDTAGVAMPPSSAFYRIDDLETGDEVLPDTAFLVPVDGTFVIKLTQNDNTIINDQKNRELRRVSVRGTYNQSGDEVPGAYDYSIERVFLAP